jgi:lipopolysaccharide transport system ATP-binding protein
MSTPAIRVEGVSKRYQVGGTQRAEQSFREMLTGVMAAPLRRLRRLQGVASEHDQFWALKDVSFEITRGSVVGIIGANGAGKSTLLKILSRITHPTHGRIEYRGRLATLLEVGTGFHPELSGRENIFLNGAILGMTRQEIRQRFDEIVEFAGVGRFLDTPVKRYSSGMYVRLAFSVAAHLQTDILIVDEVLAVGDVEFQNKCLNKMSEVSQDGRTVLFVSHNLDAIRRVCSQSMYIQLGGLAFHGDTREAIDQYLHTGRTLHGQASLDDHAERWGSGEIRVTDVEIEDMNAHPANVLMAGHDYCLRIRYRRTFGAQPIASVYASLELADDQGHTVWLVSSVFNRQYARVTTATGVIECRVADFNLAPGNYVLTIYLGRSGSETFDCLKSVLSVTVAGGDYFATGHPGLPLHCRTLTRCDWTMNA